MSLPGKNKCNIIHQITVISINILPSSPLGYRVDWNHFILKSLPGIVLGILKTTRFTWSLYVYPDFLVAQTVKCLSTMWETQVRSLGQEDPLEKEMATHSSTIA